MKIEIVHYLLAFLSGIFLNLMPCILPILSIKALSVVKFTTNKDKNIVKISSIATFFGIVLFFLIIAIIIGYSKHLKQTYIWGQYFQNEIFLVFAILTMFYFLGLSLNYNLFSFKTGSHKQDPVIQGLFYGLTVPLISTPCIGPFMSSVITIISSSKNHITSSILIVLIGVGLGFPYLLIALMKNPAKLLPKPGKWMNIVRKMSFIMIFLTIIWLVFILYQNNTGLLYSFVVVIFGAFLFLIVKSSKFVIKSIIWLMIAIIASIVATNVIKVFVDYKHTKLVQPTEIDFDVEKMEKYLASGKIVVVRFTADWCATCKLMDIYLFNSSEISDFLIENNAIYMVADMTSRNKNQEAQLFARENKINGVPAIYIASPKRPDGEIYMGLLKKDEFKNIITAYL